MKSLLISVVVLLSFGSAFGQSQPVYRVAKHMVEGNMAVMVLDNMRATKRYHYRTIDQTTGDVIYTRDSEDGSTITCAEIKQFKVGEPNVRCAELEPARQ